MSEQIHFDQEYLLSGRLDGLTQGETIALGRGLCLALHARAGACIGGVQPGNVSLSPEGLVGLGDGSDPAARSWSSEELEYLAPELFWNGAGDVRADLYAVGLMMYAALNGGLLPFAAEGEATASDRAQIFKQRMGGQPVPQPQQGDDALREAVMKALAFSPEQRWQTPAAFLDALNACAGTCDTPVPTPVGIVMELPEVPEVPAEATDDAAAPVQDETAPAEDVPADELPADVPREDAPAVQEEADNEDKAPVAAAIPVSDPEEREQPRRRLMPYLVAVLACIAIVLVALLLRSFHPPKPAEPNEPATPLDTLVTTVPNDPDVPDEPVEPISPDVTDDPLAPEDPDVPTEPTESGELEDPAEPGEPTEPAEPAEPDTPVRQDPPQPDKPRYELVLRDCSWGAAKEICEQMGGHLATISDAAELAEVTALAEQRGIGLLWVGAYRDLMGNWSWVTGEEIDFYRWGKGQPSAYDSDGTPEDYLLLWLRKGSWIYNDSRNDPVKDYPGAYSGKIAFVCEYETS